MRAHRHRVVASAHLHDSSDACSGSPNVHNGHPYAVADGLAAQLRVRLLSWQGGPGNSGFHCGFRDRVGAGYDDVSTSVSYRSFSRHPGIHPSTIAYSSWLIFGGRSRRPVCFTGVSAAKNNAAEASAITSEANAITSDFANPDDIVIRPTARLSQRVGSNGLVACPDPQSGISYRALPG